MPDVFGTVYAGWHGIEGVLKEELLDLSAQPRRGDRAAERHAGRRLHRHVPLQAQGRARQEDFERVIEVFKAHDIGYFFYNGGNDSMDTAHKIAKLAHEHGPGPGRRSACPRPSTTTSATASSS